METNYYQSDLAIHPGEFLEETLEDLGMSQIELSNRIGRPSQAINEIIKGKKSITSATALELEDVLNVPAHIWVGLESEYQMVKAREAELQQMEEETALLPKFAYPELAKMGLVKTTRKAIEKVEGLKRFFSVAKLGQIEHIKLYQPAFRVSNHKQVSHEAIASWIQAGTSKAQLIETKHFEKQKLEQTLDSLKKLMTLDDINQAVSQLEQLLALCGVAFVMLPHFKGTKVNGAAFWINEKSKAVVIMTIRGSFSDIFWFSLFHEIAHLLLHQKRQVFLEDGCDDPLIKKQEDEADRFAREFLIPSKDFNTFVSKNQLTRDSIISFAEQLNIKPSIVVGRLMHEKIINYNHYSLSKLRDRYQWPPVLA